MLLTSCLLEGWGHPGQQAHSSAFYPCGTTLLRPLQAPDYLPVYVASSERGSVCLMLLSWGRGSLLYFGNLGILGGQSCVSYTQTAQTEVNQDVTTDF